ncbi:FAD-dependent oxidoreductase [Microbacterium sp. BK668]|uniref:FAD-dependent oxidoreductase n=1 Tax=Microbacterium sp. BK668 TaxID=2512118 RepID=UPI00105CFF42|nr:FAD-dependent oxidoreductase [Microbacterium sp. BK668]TDN90803.1 2-polyprenyl-6-methoxyphenol hydroxylase-like FAD-dependent oxidoreductase [Microbacterium sp. BK668]
MSESPAKVFARLGTRERPDVGTPRLQRAVVLGGSVAGLLAARVLADNADEVIVLERDEDMSGGEDGRRGVPQRLQVHALLPGGRAQIERWFPGFGREAVEQGAVASTPQQSEQWIDDVRAVSSPNVVLLNGSRTFIEALLRRRTLALPNVRLVPTAAAGLVYREGRVTGVRLAAGDESVLPADFVVDAMGRSSRLAAWLDRDGWESPPMERMQIDVNYATAYFARSDDEPRVAVATSRVSPGYPKKTHAALTAVEGGRWMLLQMTYGDDRPPQDWGGFLDRCASLPPVFAEVARGRPIGEVHAFRLSEARRRRYDLLQRLPGGLISVGDAVASFNPIYGQGMSAAALHASCLSEYLRGPSDPTGMATRFFELQKVVVDAAWDLSTQADAQRLETARPPLPIRLRRAVVDQVLAAAVVDVPVATAFNEVAFMNAHPSTLAAPSVVLRSVASNLRVRARASRRTITGAVGAPR